MPFSVIKNKTKIVNFSSRNFFSEGDTNIFKSFCLSAMVKLEGGAIKKLIEFRAKIWKQKVLQNALTFLQFNLTDTLFLKFFFAKNCRLKIKESCLSY